MTHIWVPKVKIYEGEINAPKGRIAGQYTIKKYKEGFKEPVQVVGPFENLITNTGLNAIGSEGCNYIFVGTGTAAPTATDTQLGNFLKETSSYAPSGSWNGRILRGGAPDYWVQGAGTWRFAQGVAQGTLTEIGFGYLAPAGGGQTIEDRHRCFSKALIVDGNGSPNPITVLLDEYLDVTYSTRFYPHVGPDITQVLNLSGSSYIMVSRAIGIESNSDTFTNPTGLQQISGAGAATFYTGTAAGTPPTLASVTDLTLGTPGAAGGVTPSANAYVPGSYEISSVISAGLTQANLTYGLRGAIIRCVAVSSLRGAAAMSFQTTITPAIPKDNTKVLQFGVKYGWARK